MANGKKNTPAKNIVKNKKVKSENEIKETKKRGRPRKIKEETIVAAPKKRGRPKKVVTEEKVIVEKKKRGRPRKIKEETNVIQPEKKKRGRHRKTEETKTTKKKVIENIEPEVEITPTPVPFDEIKGPKKNIFKNILHILAIIFIGIWSFIKLLGRSIKQLSIKYIIPTIKYTGIGIYKGIKFIGINLFKGVKYLCIYTYKGIKWLLITIYKLYGWYCIGLYEFLKLVDIHIYKFFKWLILTIKNKVYPFIKKVVIYVFSHIWLFIKWIFNVIILILGTCVKGIHKGVLSVSKWIKEIFIKIRDKHRINKELRKEKRILKKDEKIEAQILKEEKKQEKQLPPKQEKVSKKEIKLNKKKKEEEIKGKIVYAARPLVNYDTGVIRRVPDDDLILLRYRDQKGIFRKILAFFRNRIKVVKFDMKRFRKRIKYGTIFDKILVFIMICLIIGFTGVVAFCVYIVKSAPEVTESNFYSSNSTIIYDGNGNELVRIGAEAREKVTYDDLPEVLIDAIVATEDARFFQHNGVDLARFTKAAIGQVLGHDDAGGGSTLTMQLSKNFATSKEAHGIGGIIRKFTDVYLSVFVLEKRYTKEQIMEFYVNNPFLGSNSYGVEQACQTYFGKSVTEITLPEAAMIAGLFQAPSTYNPYSYPENAEKRRNTVLNLMVRHGYISEQEAEDAKSIPIKSMLSTKSYGISIYQGFIDTVTAEVEERTGQNPYNVSMLIYSTLDPKKQDVINNLYDTYKWKNPEYTQAGIAVVSVADGSILAVGAGRNKTTERSFNLATSARRQPGSVAKPVLDYGPAIEYHGWGTGTTVIDDVYGYTVGGNIKNYDNKFKGILTAKKALAGSRNIPALYAFQQTTNQEKRSFAESLGWYHVPDDGNGNYLESSAIGGFEGITPLEAAATYATFARGGTYIEPYSVTKVIMQDTEEVIEIKPKKVQAMSEETAYIINMILKYAVTSGTINPGKVKGTDLAAKTGTTTIDAKRKAQLSKTAIGDSWQVTYSPDYAIALWYGYETNTKEHHLIQKESTTNRRSISQKLVAGIMKQNSTFRRPSGVVTVDIELETDPVQLASEYTPSNLRSKEIFKKTSAPSDVSNRFEKLSNVPSVTYTSTESSVILSWQAAPVPDAIKTDYLLDYFNKSNLYKHWAQKYYNNRIKYNNENLGEFGYRVYMKTPEGGTKDLGFTKNTSFVANVQFSEKTQFIIKTTYSKFTANASDGYYLNVEPNSTNQTTPDDPTNTTNKTTKEVTKNLTMSYRIDGGCSSLSAFNMLGGTAADKVQVLADGKDVTNSANISYTCYTSEGEDLDSCSKMTDDGEYKVMFNASYNKLNVAITIDIKPSC